MQVPAEHIASARLILLPVTEAAASAVLDGSPAAPVGVRGWPDADTLDALRLALAYGGEVGWFITRDELVVGLCGTHGPPDGGGTVEIRYAVAHSVQGQGIASETCAALTGWLLSRPGVRRVEASTSAAGNPGSRRVLERSGFALDRLEGPMAWYAREVGS